MGVHVEFIDLPAGVFLVMGDFCRRQAVEGQDRSTTAKKQAKSVYQRWAELAGETDDDTYWERSFEHNLNNVAYRLAVYQFGKSLREIFSDNRQEYAKNLIREAYMRRQVEKQLSLGMNLTKLL